MAPPASARARLHVLSRQLTAVQDGHTSELATAKDRASYPTTYTSTVPPSLTRETCSSTTAPATTPDNALYRGNCSSALSSLRSGHRAPFVQSVEEYRHLHAWSLRDPASFWEVMAADYTWRTPFPANHLSFNFDVRKGPIFARWFEGGTTNLCYNALDRWVEAGQGNRPCFIWEGNDAATQHRTMSYAEVLADVCRLGAWLRKQGVRKGDAVTLYLPMGLQLPIAMLACARIGAVHSVVFGGFSAEALAQRLQDCGCKVLVTASGTARGKKALGLKAIADTAVALSSHAGHQVSSMLVYEDASAVPASATPWTPGRDVWWGDALTSASVSSSSTTDSLPSAAAATPRPLQQSAQDTYHSLAALCPVEWLASEDRAFLLYTSGSTGKPKGVVHTVGGYMVATGTSSKYVLDIRPADVFWCTADCGWITGHTYLVYGPLLRGASVVVFGSTPTHPDPGRIWRMVQQYKVRQLYTSPTLIRSLEPLGDSWVTRYDLSSLQLLGVVGEPIHAGAWNWAREVIGQNRCPIVDTWWQTETGTLMISPFPGAWCKQIPGCASLPFFGVHASVLNAQGEELHGEAEGLLVLSSPHPSLARTLHNDHERYQATYFAPMPGHYFTGDGCRRDADGYIWITGRVDDVINVSGHRIGTAEVEGALSQHPSCEEAAVIGVDHPIKGQAIYAYVALAPGVRATSELRSTLLEHVRNAIGPFAVPDTIHWALTGLPKTRSGKILRRVLRKIASKQEGDLGDLTTLAEPHVVVDLIESRGM